MRTTFLIFLIPLAASACAPSPLYLAKPGAGTPGEVPRDERGNPIWERIPPTPPPSRPVPPDVLAAQAVFERQP